MIDFVTIPEERVKVFRENSKKFNKKIRNFFDVEISTEGDDMKVEGESSVEVSRTKEIVRAFGRGFEFDDALSLVDEDFILDMVKITEFSGKSKNRKRELKGRVIGAEGKAVEVIEKYSRAKLAVYGKTVSIVGKWDSVELAKKAVIMLLNGARHTTVFKFLEENRIV